MKREKNPSDIVDQYQRDLRIRRLFDQAIPSADLSLEYTEDQIYLDQRFELHSDAIAVGMERFFEAVTNDPVLEVPGHEIQSHLFEVVAKTYRILSKYPQLSGAERVEAVLAATFHDADRVAETELSILLDDDGKSIKATNLLLHIYGKYIPQELRKDKKFIQLFAQRILYTIANHHKADPQRVTSRIVIEADRLELFGVATIARGMAYDIGFYSPLKQEMRLDLPKDLSDLASQLAKPKSPEDVFNLLQYLFYCENVYPMFDDWSRLRAQDQKVEQLAVLALASQHLPEESQRFLFPGIVSEETEISQGCVGRKPLTEDEFLALTTEISTFKDWYSQRKEMLPLQGAKQEKEDLLLDLIKNLRVVEGVVEPENFDETMKTKIADLDESFLENWTQIIFYTLYKRQQQWQEYLDWLEAEIPENIIMEKVHIWLKMGLQNKLRRLDERFAEFVG